MTPVEHNFFNIIETAVSMTQRTMTQQTIQLPFFPRANPLALLTLLLHRYSGEERIQVWVDGQAIRSHINAQRHLLI